MSDIFQANGSPEDQAKLLAPINRIYFPWALLQPELLRSSVGHIQLEFADLSHFVTATDVQGEREDHIVDDDGNVGHIMYAEHLPEEFHAVAAVGSVAGLAWYGKIQVEQFYRDHQAMIDFVIGAECAHEADYFYINVHGMRPALAQLVHPMGPDSHGWFEGSYFDQIGESWMSGFSIAYSDAQPDMRFTHIFTREMIPQIHEILHAERTDKEPPEPPVDPSATPEITNVKPKGSRKTRVIGRFDPAATLTVNGRLSDAGVEGDRFTLRKLNPGRYEFVVTNPNGKSTPPYVYNVVAD